MWSCQDISSPSGQHLTQDGRCIFVETSLNSNNSIFPGFWNGLVGFLTERIEFSCLIQVDEDRFCSGLCSERMHQILNLDHSSLIFKYCILWYSLDTKIKFEEISCCTRLLCRDTLVKYSSTRFSESVVVWESLDTKFCPLSCLSLFQCNQRTLSHKGWWHEIASVRMVILYFLFSQLT